MKFYNYCVEHVTNFNCCRKRYTTLKTPCVLKYTGYIYIVFVIHTDENIIKARERNSVKQLM